MGEIVSEAEDITIIDMEASLEHLSRGTVRHVDALLVVTEPYYRSLETARRTFPLAGGLGINHLYTIVNKIRSPEDERAVGDFCRRNEMEIIARVPFDEAVMEADQNGRSLYDHAPEAAPVGELERLAERLLEKVPLNSSTASKYLAKKNC